MGEYKFIGRGCGVGEKGQKLTYTQAWETFRRSLSSARIPCKPISRYPVVARWRTDVDYVAAGIYCFQPFCVTGELPPPANPLICPQFCVRFNDLDNIGLTGRHYSGFVMLGLQAFNLPQKYVFFKEECVEFNLRWLTEELQIPKNRITLVEDVWAGGGNLGPCVEYFVDGLELGNMVFMQYKTFPDGHREELPVKVVDVGVGLERIPWLINGSASSYEDTFSVSREWLGAKLGVNVHNEVWRKFAPLSCRLNVDEAEDLSSTWTQISSLIGLPVDQVKAEIGPIRDLYILLDHTRTALITIEDGSLPSNVGGGSNVRNILRRVFALMKKRGWWDSIGISGLMELFSRHKTDLEGLYGPFKSHKSFKSIIEGEFDRWTHTDSEQAGKLARVMKKNKGKLSLEDWVVAVTSWGIPVDVVANTAKQEIPGNLYYTIAEQQEKLTKSLEPVLYSTAHLPETLNLYYDNPLLSEFSAKIIETPDNADNPRQRNILILDQSAFYPTSGGQTHDTGTVSISGTEYTVIDVQKVGPVVLHFLAEPLPSADYTGTTVTGRVDMQRRLQLRCHHTAAHLLFAACKSVLGPHIWQNGAKKTVDGAHLDVTHYKAVSFEEETAIENEANRTISRCIPIKTGFMEKSQGELKYGFTLYQGGVVPGNSLRVVDVEGVDVEACCGTHCGNTGEVGRVRLVKTSRISDGVVRLQFVAGEKALQQQNCEANVLHTLMTGWNVPLTEVVSTADRFFTGFKRLETKSQRQETKILELTVTNMIAKQGNKYYLGSEQENPTFFFSNLPNYAEELKNTGKSVVFIGNSFVFGLLGDGKAIDLSKI